MAQTENLTRYDVVKSGKDGWELKTGGKTVAWRESKTALVDDLQATLDRVGDGDGTVRIHTEIGGIEEERTYPRSKDPPQVARLSRSSSRVIRYPALRKGSY